VWLTVVRQTLHGPLRQLSSVTRPLHLRLPRSTSTSWHELPIRNSPRSVPLGVRLTNADAKGGAAGALIGSNQFPKAGVNQCHGEDPLPVLETERAYRSRAVERVGFERDGNRPLRSVVVISRSPHEHLERRTFTVDAIEKCDVGADKVECNGSLRGEQVFRRVVHARAGARVHARQSEPGQRHTSAAALFASTENTGERLLTEERSWSGVRYDFGTVGRRGLERIASGVAPAICLRGRRTGPGAFGCAGTGASPSSLSLVQLSSMFCSRCCS